jgi:hypothetical protein
MAAVTDDELLALLGRVFRPRKSEPPARVLAALRRAAASRAEVVAKGRGKWRWAYAVVVGVLGVSSGVAYSAVAGMPDVVRNASHAIGLPVTPTAINHLHDAERRLEGALARHDQDEASRQATVVRERLDDLSDRDRAREAPSAEALLEREERESPRLPTSPQSTVPGQTPAPGQSSVPDQWSGLGQETTAESNPVPTSSDAHDEHSTATSTGDTSSLSDQPKVGPASPNIGTSVSGTTDASIPPTISEQDGQ